MEFMLDTIGLHECHSRTKAPVFIRYFLVKCLFLDLADGSLTGILNIYSNLVSIPTNLI